MARAPPKPLFIQQTRRLSMLINLREMLQIAEKKHSAIGSFNVYNVESLQAVMNASAKASAPVIVSFGESYDSHMPLEGMAELVKLYAAASEVPIVLHLDHSKKGRGPHHRSLRHHPDPRPYGGGRRRQCTLGLLRPLFRHRRNPCSPRGRRALLQAHGEAVLPGAMQP